MNKNLEELKRSNLYDHNLTSAIETFDDLGLQYFITYYLVPILEDFGKRLKTIEAELGIYTEEEIKEIKVGGTDPD